MSRVEWSRRSPDEVEEVIGIMLCRAYPQATRIRPSQGDRGIDVYIPEDGKWTLYQVKSFTGSLTSSQKRQISKSFRRFLDFAAERELDVREWLLIRPENPTLPDENWLEELTKDAPFPCRWRGKDHCDALAADHQSVIDYYFHDGKGRLEVALKDLLAALGATGDNVPSEPGQAYHGLQAIHSALNGHDPHYRYDFSVNRFDSVDEFRAVAPPTAEENPGLVAAVTRGADGTAITFRIYARYEEATSDRPVPGRFTLRATPGSAEALALQDFVDYGLPVTGTQVSDLALDLPGGLGTTAQEGTVSIGPARLEAAQSVDLELVILDGGEAEIAAAAVVMDPPTTGLDGQRFALKGRERSGVFHVSIRVDAPGRRMHMSLKAGDLTGVAPADAIPGLNVLNNMKPPNQFLLRMRNGPRIDGPHLVPEEFVIDVENELKICEALATIQRHTVLPLRVPSTSSITADQANEWLRVGRLLRGDSLAITWDRVGVTLHEGVSLPGSGEDAFAIATTTSLVTSVSGIDVDLGMQLTHLAAARIEDEAPSPAGSVTVQLVPAGNNAGTLTWVRPGVEPLQT